MESEIKYWGSVERAFMVAAYDGVCHWAIYEVFYTSNAQPNLGTEDRLYFFRRRCCEFD